MLAGRLIGLLGLTGGFCSSLSILLDPARNVSVQKQSFVIQSKTTRSGHQINITVAGSLQDPHGRKYDKPA